MRGVSIISRGVAISIAMASAVVVTACTRGGCDGPALDFQTLDTFRRAGQQSASGQGQGPLAGLVFPNPIDATGQALMSARGVSSDSFEAFSLQNLLSPQRLENNFLRVRIKDMNDAVSTLARPDGQGRFVFALTDPHYSEAMAYYAITSEMRYVEALGFGVVKSRPLYVAVRAEGDDFNAIYDHNYLHPGKPRLMRMVGGGDHAPGLDAQMYHHEFGHLFNESASREVGIDWAGDHGAAFTEASSLHECMADYLQMSFEERPYIGRWIARNFDGYQVGEPLRSAVDENDYGKGPRKFRDAAIPDGTGKYPERYHMAMWCERVLWKIRQKFVAADTAHGAIRADMLMFSALGFLKRDTSMKEWHDALLKADDALYCGGNSDEIRTAFESRGFTNRLEAIPLPVQLTAMPVAFDLSGEQPKQIPLRGGATIVFQVSIINPNAQLARNVRIRIVPKDRGIYPTVYQQAYGDLPGGASLSIGGAGGLGWEFSVMAELDRSLGRGSSVRYELHVFVDNGPASVLEGALTI